MIDIDLLQKALSAANKNRSFAFATIVETTAKGTPRKAGAKMVVMNNGQVFGSVGGGIDEEKIKKACLKAIRTGSSELVVCEDFGRPGEPQCGGFSKIFIEPFCGVKELVICGAGHIALPLSAIGKIIGFKAVIIDPRPEFANKSRFPHADEVLTGPYKKILTAKKRHLDLNSYIVIMTYGHQHDYECLKIVLRTEAAYIGLIGSQNKKQKFLGQLKKDGFTKKEIERITVPTGIDIGAQTPEEIAVSIAAELVALQNPLFCGSDKFLNKISGR
jgi:xanthine dehydrogenase accessory factor